jgi:hypothetical protein
MEAMEVERIRVGQVGHLISHSMTLTTIYVLERPCWQLPPFVRTHEDRADTVVVGPSKLLETS